MKYSENTQLIKIVVEEYKLCHAEQYQKIVQKAKSSILKVQLGQQTMYNKKRKVAIKYRPVDLVSIKYTQFLPISKYLGI